MQSFKILLNSFQTLNTKHALVRPNDRILIGLSGGLDSIALLFFLRKLAQKYSLELYAANLNHQINPAFGRSSKTFCQGLCDRLGVKLISAKIDVPSVAKSRHGNLEEVARELRYAFLVQSAKKWRCHAIATAHHRGDQAETAFFNVLRGAGLKGLAGIAPIKMLDGVRVIRPLLGSRRTDLKHFLQDIREAWVEDPSNDQLNYSRNKLRHRIFPYIEKSFERSLEQNLANLSDIAQETQEFLDILYARSFRTAFLAKKKGLVSLSLSKLKAMHPVVQKGVLIQAWSQLRGHSKGLDSRHLEQILHLIKSHELQAKLSLPNRCQALKKSASFELTCAIILASK